MHAASQASPKYYKTDPVGTLLPNVMGTKNLLELARNKELKCFIFISSGEIYGRMQNDNKKIIENTYGYLYPLNVRSCYGESKRMGENMCIAWHRQYQVPVKIIRLFHTYGPGMKLDDGRVFADFVADIVKKKDIIIKSDGKAVRTFCYLADAVTAFFYILFKGNMAESYNVGNDKGISIKDLAHTLSNMFSERKIKVILKANQNIPDLKSTLSKVIPDITKIYNLGWKPQFSIEEGFSRTVRSHL